MKTYTHTGTHIYKLKRIRSRVRKILFRDLHTRMHKKLYKEASVQLFSCV